MKSKLPVVILAVLLVASIGIAFMLNSQQADTISSMEAKEKDLKSEIADLENELSALNSDVAEKETFISKLNSEVDALNGNVTKLVTDLEKAESFLDQEMALKEKWTAYILPEKIIGEWSVVNLVLNDGEFKPNAPLEERWLKGIKFNTKTVSFDTGEGYLGSMPWVDDHIFDDNSAMGYRIESIEGKDYMFLEWKSGDYQRDNRISYYVLEKRIQ